MSRKLIVVEPTLCTGCLQCELVCSLHKTGIANPANSRIKVTKIEEKGIYKPILCRQCNPAPCIEVCPTEAITQDVKTGSIIISQELCIECGECITACPFGAIYFSTDGDIISCDLCGGDPVCVKYCQARPENSSAFMANPRASALQFVEAVDATLTKRLIRVRKFEEAV